MVYFSFTPSEIRVGDEQFVQPGSAQGNCTPSGCNDVTMCNGRAVVYLCPGDSSTFVINNVAFTLSGDGTVTFRQGSLPIVRQDTFPPTTLPGGSDPTTLPSGAEVMIVVGVSMAFLALLGVLYTTTRRRSRKN